VYNGPLNRLCLDLSENEQFRRMWGIPLDPKPEEKNDDEELDETTDEWTAAGVRMFQKMEDAELVLRFFAYRRGGSTRSPSLSTGSSWSATSFQNKDLRSTARCLKRPCSSFGTC